MNSQWQSRRAEQDELYRLGSAIVERKKMTREESDDGSFALQCVTRAKLSMIYGILEEHLDMLQGPNARIQNVNDEPDTTLGLSTYPTMTPDRVRMPLQQLDFTSPNSALGGG